jgi:hypothetical protein
MHLRPVTTSSKPTPPFIPIFHSILFPQNNLQSRISLRRRSKILIPIFRHQQIIFNPNTTYIVILRQYLFINILSISRIGEIYLFKGESGEITLVRIVSKENACWLDLKGGKELTFQVRR